MAEYIERDFLISKFMKHLRKYPNACYSASEIKLILNNVPTANVVEIVMCKDCKHRYVPVHCALWYGTFDGKEYFIERGNDFSCSYGVRKEGVEE